MQTRLNGLKASIITIHIREFYRMSDTGSFVGIAARSISELSKLVSEQ